MEGIFIFVCDRGFVHAGEGGPHPELPFHWHLIRSRTIRRWGTTNGLAELKDGPTPLTVLDEVCERTLPFRSILDIIHLTQEGVTEWKKALSS